MEPDKQYHSYLVRVWCDEVDQEGGSPIRWQGEVIHIQSGRSWRFNALEPLMDLLKEITAQGVS